MGLQQQSLPFFRTPAPLCVTPQSAARQNSCSTEDIFEMNPLPVACALSLDDVVARQPENKSDPKEMLALRCFEANYAIVLLRDVYRWNADDKKFHFTSAIRGSSVDWPLGAYVALSVPVEAKTSDKQFLGQTATGSFQYPAIYWLENFAAACIAVLLLFWLYRRCRRHSFDAYGGAKTGSPATSLDDLEFGLEGVTDNRNNGGGQRSKSRTGNGIGKGSLGAEFGLGGMKEFGLGGTGSQDEDEARGIMASHDRGGLERGVGGI